MKKPSAFRAVIPAALLLGAAAYAQQGTPQRPGEPSMPPTGASRPGGSQSSTDPAMGAPASGLPGDRATGMDKASGTTSDVTHTRIVKRLHHGNLMEIEAGGLAQQNGTDAVRAFGKTLVDDHKKADVDLLNAASRLGISMVMPGERAGSSMGAARTPMDDSGKADRDDARTEARDTDNTARRDRDAATGSGGDMPMHRMDPGHRAMLEDLRDVHGVQFDRQFLTMMVRDHKKTIDDARAARDKLSQADPLATLIDQQLPTLQKHLDTAQQLLKKAQQPQ